MTLFFVTKQWSLNEEHIWQSASLVIFVWAICLATFGGIGSPRCRGNPSGGNNLASNLFHFFSSTCQARFSACRCAIHLVLGCIKCIFRCIFCCFPSVRVLIPGLVMGNILGNLPAW